MRHILISALAVGTLAGCDAHATRDDVFTTAIVHVGADGSLETSVFSETLAERYERSAGVGATQPGLATDAVVDGACTKGDTILCDAGWNPRAIPPGPWQCYGNVACITGSDSISLTAVPRGSGNFAGNVKSVYVGGWSGDLRTALRTLRPCTFSFSAYSPGWQTNACPNASVLDHFIN